MSFKLIHDCSEKHPDAEAALAAWHKVAGNAAWKDLSGLQNDYPGAYLLAGDRLIFPIKGNRYRIVARVAFEHKRISVRWAGPHTEYYKIDAAAV